MEIPSLKLTNYQAAPLSDILAIGKDKVIWIYELYPNIKVTGCLTVCIEGSR